MRRQRRISESVINRAINNSMRRMVNEGTTDSDVIDKWQEVKDSLGDTISIIKIDVDKNQQISSKYQVRGVPTMILFQNGKQLWRQSGVLTKEQIIKTILEKKQ